MSNVLAVEIGFTEEGTPFLEDFVATCFDNAEYVAQDMYGDFRVVVGHEAFPSTRNPDLRCILRGCAICHMNMYPKFGSRNKFSLTRSRGDTEKMPFQQVFRTNNDLFLESLTLHPLGG